MRRIIRNEISENAASKQANDFLSSIGFDLNRTTVTVTSIKNRAGKYWYIQANYKGKKNKEKSVDLYIDKSWGKIIRVDKD